MKIPFDINNADIFVEINGQLTHGVVIGVTQYMKEVKLVLFSVKTAHGPVIYSVVPPQPHNYASKKAIRELHWSEFEKIGHSKVLVLRDGAFVNLVQYIGSFYMYMDVENLPAGTKIMFQKRPVCIISRTPNGNYVAASDLGDEIFIRKHFFGDIVL